LQDNPKELHSTVNLFSDKNNLSNSILDNANLIILVWKGSGNLIKFNNYAQKLTGFQESEMLGNGWDGKLVDDALKKIMMIYFNDLSKANIPSPHETYVFDRTGRKIDVFWNNSVIYDEDNKPSTYIAMGTDVSDRKIAEEKLLISYKSLEILNGKLSFAQQELKTKFQELQASQESLKEIEEKSRLAIEGSKDGTWDWKIKDNKFSLSTRCKAMLGFKGEELQDTTSSWIKLIHSEDLSSFQQAMKMHLNKTTLFFNINTRMKTKVGTYKWILIRGKAIFDDKNLPIRMAGSTSDITNRKKNEETIYKLAYYDSLTNLPNRTLANLKLEDELKKARKYNTKLAILYMDLDNFKSINDSFGHYFGDKLLIEVTNSFNKFIDEKITVSRLGGDEFLILIPDVSGVVYATKLANKILKSLYRPFSIENNSIFVTASIGIAISPDDGLDIQTLLKNADTAMYHAKAQGKNNYKLFTKKLNDKLVKKMELEKTLRFSLLNCKEQEFTVYYQPQINAKSGELAGLEALVRWFHPEHGFIPPNDFIPIAEETGLVSEIDEFVLRATCNQQKQWQLDGRKIVPVSVNISAHQFKHKNLFDKIQNILQETDLSPEWLHIEITESATISDMSTAIKILNKFKAIGVKVLLDDFGTGYSSLNHLKNLPISTLKIDKSFVDQIAHGEHEKAIAYTLIQLAHCLNMDVIAEGVETIEQLAVLKEQNCDTIQGYLFSKPLPAIDLETFLPRELLSNKPKSMIF
jgi:diguanylate cyclase (GGDEF)-like protein/PAS domain S-box-containing protein